MVTDDMPPRAQAPATRGRPRLSLGLRERAL